MDRLFIVIAILFSVATLEAVVIVKLVADYRSYLEYLRTCLRKDSLGCMIVDRLPIRDAVVKTIDKYRSQIDPLRAAHDTLLQENQTLLAGNKRLLELVDNEKAKRDLLYAENKKLTSEANQYYSAVETATQAAKEAIGSLEKFSNRQDSLEAQRKIQMSSLRYLPDPILPDTDGIKNVAALCASDVTSDQQGTL